MDGHAKVAKPFDEKEVLRGAGAKGSLGVSAGSAPESERARKASGAAPYPPPTRSVPGLQGESRAKRSADPERAGPGRGREELR